jgi:hypothetical protein
MGSPGSRSLLELRAKPSPPLLKAAGAAKALAPRAKR